MFYRSSRKGKWYFFSVMLKICGTFRHVLISALLYKNIIIFNVINRSLCILLCAYCLYFISCIFMLAGLIFTCQDRTKINLNWNIRVSREAFVVSSKILFQHTPGGTEKYSQKTSIRTVSLSQRIKPWSCHLKDKVGNNSKASIDSSRF